MRFLKLSAVVKEYVIQKQSRTRPFYIYQIARGAVYSPLKSFNPTSFPHFLKQAVHRRRYCTSFDPIAMQKMR